MILVFTITTSNKRQQNSKKKAHKGYTKDKPEKGNRIAISRENSFIHKFIDLREKIKNIIKNSLQITHLPYDL